MALGGMIGRIGQGMNLGRAPPIDAAKVAEAAAEVATGGKLAATKTALKTAGSATGSFVQGAAVGAGYRASGIIGKIFGFFWDTIIANNNEYDLFIKIAAVMYFADFIHGFNPGIVLAEHLIFAIVAFILIAERNASISRWNYIWVTIIFLSIWQVTLQGPVFVLRATGGAVLLAIALVLYLRSGVPMPLRGIPFIAAIDVLVLNVFRVPLLQYAENAGFAFVAVSHVMNRMLNPILLFYGLIYMKRESPVVAGRVFVIVFFIYLFAAATPILADTIKHYREGSTPLTSEEGQQAGNVITTAARNFVNFVTLKFVNPSVAYAYEKAEETFGFGEPKEEPKVGLQLRDNPTMQGEFDKALEIPTASAAVSMLSPLRGENIRALYITGVECSDKTQTDSVGSVKGTIIGEDEESLRKGVAVVYGRDRTVYCEFTGQSEMKPGKKLVEIKVTYDFYTTAYADSALMRSDKLDEQLIAAADKGGVVKVRADNAIPPAKAEYDNGPVAVKWGPLDLSVTPVAINADRPKPYWIEVHVFKSSEWEGDINAVKELHLVVPPSVVLKEDRFCAFTKTGNNIYKLKESFAKAFIGDGKVFKCNIEISNTILGGGDWAAVRFEAYGNFAISLRKQVSFEVKGENPGQQANQQLQQAQAQQEQAGQDISQGGVDGQ